MSWSLNTKCFHCSHKDNCVDEALVNSAIGDIHYLGTERGHLGAGVIEMKCQNFDLNPKKKKSE